MSTVEPTASVNRFLVAVKVEKSLLEITGGVSEPLKRRPFIELHSENRRDQTLNRIETLTNNILQLQDLRDKAFKIVSYVKREFILKIDEEAKGLSKDSPSEYEYSPYEKHMNQLNLELEAKFLRNIKNILTHEIKVGLELDNREALQSLVEAHFENLRTLVQKLETGEYKGQGSPSVIKALAETILPPLSGMEDKNTKVIGILDEAQTRIEEMGEEIYRLKVLTK